MWVPWDFVQAYSQLAIVQGCHFDGLARDGVGECNGSQVDQVVSTSRVRGMQDLAYFEDQIRFLSLDGLVASLFESKHSIFSMPWLDFQQLLLLLSG